MKITFDANGQAHQYGNGMAPEVDPAELFSVHPELLDWYNTNIARPVEDIASMEMGSLGNDRWAIWIVFKTEPYGIGYRAFQQVDGRFIQVAL